MSDKSKVEELDEKADFYYEYSAQIYKEKLEKYRRLEDKALKLLTLLGVITTALVLILRLWKTDIFDNKTGFMIVVIWIELILLILCLFSAWGHILASIKTRPLKMLTDDKNVQYFIMKTEQPIYDSKIAIAKEILKNSRELAIFYADKVKYVQFAEDEIKYSGFIFIIFMFTISVLAKIP
ncbi:hypothetical protein [Providencia rettgeri]|uniref:hypothetical protein n=1 Tax=Providencia rettgeri TaxID=587 RepID=UPI0018E43657|nr:hypothetical protein [Providencia rettgeri]MBI6191841.1 hypothetical protein [Providencia rettgeri]